MLAHKLAQMDTIAPKILARNVKVDVLVVQVLINATIAKRVLIYLKVNVSKNAQSNSILKEINASIVLIHVLSVLMRMDAHNA